MTQNVCIVHKFKIDLMRQKKRKTTENSVGSKMMRTPYDMHSSESNKKKTTE